MKRYKFSIEQILDNGSMFIHLDSIDVEDMKDKNEVTEKIEEINIATNSYYSEDIKTVKFTISRDDKPIWTGRGSIINRDQDIVVNRPIKVEELIGK